jgi:glycosidase
MPINPIGEKNRKGSLGSYYSVKDYLDVNPDFGTKADFKDLVDKTHKLGMYIIIDWVANHTSWDNILTVEHPDWFTKDSIGNFIPPVADWSDVIDLNYDNKELWHYMTDALKYWVKEFNIDGYRCDVAGMVPDEFWNNIRIELDKIKPVFMLAEDESPKQHEKAFDMTYAWVMHKICNDIAKGKKNVHDINSCLKKEKEEYPGSAFRMRFTSNHDENSWNGTEFERLGDAAETFAALTVVIPGMPLIYNGQEAGMNKKLEFFERDPIIWKESKFRELYSKLFHLKINNKALFNGERGGELINIPNTHNDVVYSIIRENGDDKVFALFNLSGKEVSVELNSSIIKGEYSDLFTNEKAAFMEIENMKIEPWGYKIYVKD